MNNKIDARPVAGKPVKSAGNTALLGHVALDHQIRSHRFGKRAKPLAKPLHLVGEGKLGTGLGGGGGDAPGAGPLIGDTHDQPAFAGKNAPAHVRPSAVPAWRSCRQSRRSSTAPA